jgi:hypothetical protein
MARGRHGAGRLRKARCGWDLVTTVVHLPVALAKRKISVEDNTIP